MSGSTIQELVFMFEKDSIVSVQCVNVRNHHQGNDLFTLGKRYKIQDNGIVANDGVQYNITQSKFGNPILKKATIGQLPEVNDKPEDSGGSCNYYSVLIENPTTASKKYTAECNDVIEALDMTYAEANMFKEIWRSASARTLGKLKAGHSEVRGAEKIEFFAKRNAIQKGVKQ